VINFSEIRIESLKSLRIILLFLLMIGLGCTANHMDESSMMRSVRGAISEFDNSFKKMPVDGGAPWGYESVSSFGCSSWRCLVLQVIAPIGFHDKNRKSISKDKLDDSLSRQIDDLGKRNFFIGDFLINGNLNELSNRRFSEIPSHFVLAYTVAPTSSYSWNDSDNSTFDDLSAGNSKNVILPDNILLLFANGDTAFVLRKDFEVLRPCFDFNEASKLDESRLRKMNLRWIDKAKSK